MKLFEKEWWEQTTFFSLFQLSLVLWWNWMDRFWHIAYVMQPKWSFLGGCSFLVVLQCWAKRPRRVGQCWAVRGKGGWWWARLKNPSAPLSSPETLSVFLLSFRSCVLSLALLACLIEHLPFSPTFVRVAVCVFFFFSSLSLISLWRVWKRKLWKDFVSQAKWRRERIYFPPSPLLCLTPLFFLKDEWIWWEQNNFFFFSTLHFCCGEKSNGSILLQTKVKFLGDVSWCGVGEGSKKRHVYKEATVRGKER